MPKDEVIKKEIEALFKDPLRRQRLLTPYQLGRSLARISCSLAFSDL
jgi:hypothetical protein